MRIFVINLANRTDRRDAVRQSLGGNDFEFFPAIAADAMPESCFDAVDNLNWLLETGHKAEQTELGCYASHLSLWKKCVELNQPVVIMEDDFRCTDNFSRTLDYAAQRIAACGFIRLEAVESRWSDKPGLAPETLEESDGMRLLFQRMPSVRLTCYALSPVSAAALLATSGTAGAPVDHYVRRCWVHGQAIFAIEPAAITLSGHAQDSSIGGRKKSPLRHLLAPFRALYRSRERKRAMAFAAVMLPEARARLAMGGPAGSDSASPARPTPQPGVARAGNGPKVDESEAGRC